MSLGIGPGLHSKTRRETDRQRKREQEQEREQPMVVQACNPQHLNGVRSFKSSREALATQQVLGQRKLHKTLSQKK